VGDRAARFVDDDRLDVVERLLDDEDATAPQIA